MHAKKNRRGEPAVRPGKPFSNSVCVGEGSLKHATAVTTADGSTQAGALNQSGSEDRLDGGSQWRQATPGEAGRSRAQSGRLGAEVMMARLAAGAENGGSMRSRQRSVN